jgi:hypothetical protein
VKLPDLTVDAERLAPTTRFETFAADSCEIQEACVDAPGTRRLLSFAALFWNVGTADLVLGDPAGNPAYELSPCHGHYHLGGFATYELLDAAGAVVVAGHKQGFCVRDDERLPGTQTAARYDCLTQGLSVGWGDLYGEDIPCQFIDVTDVPPGAYRLRVTVNDAGLFEEASLENNVATTHVVIAPP